ncbi:glycosyl transferase family 90 [Alteromonas gilva]|uniref:Glycosyl transferase family 90 n=1 Tax=Alteromonas gilva TaxID=2987522 RepID=A0ABT5L3K7_9ALTE|nr:glycosyl transferase family 90 [Alteromonas gilva]MDC8831086.1 glycosyl transferase family 90 [Alteromonas gilva]
MQTPKEIYTQHVISLISQPNVKIDLSLYSWHGSTTVVCKSVDFTTFDATYKINPVDVMSFTNDLCTHFHENLNIKRITKSVDINLHEYHFVIETIRDIYSGIIDQLLADDEMPSSNKMVSFGFLGKQNSKPQRVQYIKMCESSPYIDYINTERFSWLDRKGKNFTSVLNLKGNYKYFFDLKGHTYSTKSYLFLASKRVFFSSEHNEKLWWEKQYLKPWENYIPVKSDLSDLKEKYELIESDPTLYDHIVSNNLSLINNELSKEAVLRNLVKEIIKNVELY